jgi:CRISPR-associated endoribonuclease Cas2 subtype I-E
VLLGPGSSVTHDALRLLARHGCALAAIGEGAVRFYTAPPLMPDSSALARAQVTRWADPKLRMETARAMYAMRFGEIVRTRDITVLRGQEGARIKRAYHAAAERHGVTWSGRRYDRENPEGSDLANQAINHAGSAMTAAASVAVAATGAIPQLGFLGSAMLELAPGVYAQPRMSAGVRGRIWTVVEGWYGQLHRGSIVMCWADATAAGGLGLTTLGEPPKDVVVHDAVLLVRRILPTGPPRVPDG